MCLKIRLLFPVFLLVTMACSEKNQNKFKKVNKDLSLCKEDLLVFADTLSMDTGLLLNSYFNERSFELKGCNLKELRGNFEFQASIILIILKINEYYLKAGYKDVMAEPVFSISLTSRKIMEEYSFMVYKRENRNNENLRTSDVKALIEKDPRFLKIKGIEKIYFNSIKLEAGANKRFRY